jgi:hypothetical protein
MSTNKPQHRHAAAASHHEQAAHYHREASHHYQIGKDYAHAAHQALVAHGHSLRALEHGQAALACYIEHEGVPLPSNWTRSHGAAISTAMTLPKNLTSIEHHANAAEHHDAARRHHLLAEKHSLAGKHSGPDHYVRASHETKCAVDHGKHALFHGDQAV